MKDQALTRLANVKIAFYGAGSMTEAILRGVADARLIDPAGVTVMNRQNAERLEALRRKYGVVAAIDEAARQDALRGADIIVLGMKPKDAADALRLLSPILSPPQLVLSVIAGLSISTIDLLLGGNRPIARTMPNTSSTIGLGATGISYSPAVTLTQRSQVEAIFAAVGISAVVEEPLIEAVNGVSGSGPAYVYYLMEAMISAGQLLGLSPEAARELTVQTVRGAAEMVLRTGEEPAELRRKVTSPGGTTQAAIETLDAFRFREGMQAAIARCAERAREMGETIRREASAPESHEEKQG